ASPASAAGTGSAPAAWLIRCTGSSSSSLTLAPSSSSFLAAFGMPSRRYLKTSATSARPPRRRCTPGARPAPARPHPTPGRRGPHGGERGGDPAHGEPPLRLPDVRGQLVLCRIQPAQDLLGAARQQAPRVGQLDATS